jgi:hypothetical protein
MAQKRSSLMYYVGGLLLLGAVAFAMTGSDNSSTRHSPPPPKHLASTSSPDDNVTEADYKAKFDKTVEKPKDAFKPIIYHEQGGGGANSNDVSAVPTEFTGGEGGWGFTGTVQENGMWTANLDNTKTGEFVDLHRGEEWKKCTVSDVQPDSVTLEGSMSSKKLLMPTVDTSTVAAKTNNNNAANMPVMPQMDITQAGAAQPDPNALIGAIGGMGGGGFGGRRGGRGRGGFGGGRGGRGGGNFGGGGGG